MASGCDGTSATTEQSHEHIFAMAYISGRAVPQIERGTTFRASVSLGRDDAKPLASPYTSVRGLRATVAAGEKEQTAHTNVHASVVGQLGAQTTPLSDLFRLIILFFRTPSTNRARLDGVLKVYQMQV